jgi:transposase-like protein
MLRLFETTAENTRQNAISPTHLPHKPLPGALEYTKITLEILNNLYPKHCPKCNITLTKTISTRKYVIRCKQCHYQTSRLKNTPLQGFKLPFHIFGWCLYESLQRYPKILSASEIKRRLGVSKNTATLLKRRLALLASDQMPKIKKLMFEEMQKNLGDVVFPREDVDLAPYIQGKNIPQIDTCALWSASQRSNSGRKRHKHGGLTSSIYLSNHIKQGAQIGVLVNSISWVGGPIIYDSIPDNTAATLRPLLDSYVAKNIPVFTDEGYKFYYRINKNHRMINHSLKSKDKRYRYSRQRWSRNSINTQCIEGHNSLLKRHFLAAYHYVSPKYSQLYLDEYAFIRNIKYYGWDSLLGEDSVVLNVGRVYPQEKTTIPEMIEKYLYKPLTLEERQLRAQPIHRNRKDTEIQKLLSDKSNIKLKKATEEYSNFWKTSRDFQRAKQKHYAYFAASLWENLPDDGWISLSDILNEISLNRKKCYRILRRWVALGLVELIDRSKPTAVNLKYEFDIRKIQPVLPDILYVMSIEQFHEFKKHTDPLIPKTYKPLKERTENG